MSQEFRFITEQASMEMFNTMNRMFCEHLVVHIDRTIDVDSLMAKVEAACADVGCFLVASELYKPFDIYNINSGN